MTPEASAEVVARLFAAAGRDHGDTHREVYADALEGVADDVGREAGRNLARHVSWERPPSVGMVVDEVNAVLRRRQEDRAAIPEAAGEPVTRAQALEWVDRIREEHGPSAMADAMEEVARRQPEGGGA